MYVNWLFWLPYLISQCVAMDYLKRPVISTRHKMRQKTQRKEESTWRFKESENEQHSMKNGVTGGYGAEVVYAYSIPAF